MNASWVVQCQSCGFGWSRTVTLSVYERESLESRPCPRCGASTLCCKRPEPKRAKRKPSREDSSERRVG